MQESVDLTICQVCKEFPATYGDGLTWSRCSRCQLKETLKNQKVVPQEQFDKSEQGFAHKTEKGLTSIILPIFLNSYTLFHYTGNCIGSVREHTDKKDYELIVVDNGSPIQPPGLQSYYADKVIKNEKNLGVTKAWNQGIRASFGEYIVLLNNDVQVFDHWLEDFKSALDVGKYDLLMAHPMYSKTEPFARATEAKKIRESFVSPSQKPYFSDFKDFSCVIFKKSLINEIGLFDEIFFNYCSDTDIFRRMDEAGKKYACCDVVPVSHIISATGYELKETPDIMNKDKKIFEDKWSKKQEVVKNTKYTLFRTPETGDMIFLLDGKEYHHILDPETLKALGFNFGDEKTIDKVNPEWVGREDISMKNYEKYL